MISATGGSALNALNKWSRITDAGQYKTATVKIKGFSIWNHTYKITYDKETHELSVQRQKWFGSGWRDAVKLNTPAKKNWTSRWIAKTVFTHTNFMTDDEKVNFLKGVGKNLRSKLLKAMPDECGDVPDAGYQPPGDDARLSHRASGISATLNLRTSSGRVAASADNSAVTRVNTDKPKESIIKTTASGQNGGVTEPVNQSLSDAAITVRDNTCEDHSVIRAKKPSVIRDKKVSFNARVEVKDINRNTNEFISSNENRYENLAEEKNTRCRVKNKLLIRPDKDYSSEQKDRINSNWADWDLNDALSCFRMLTEGQDLKTAEYLNKVQKELWKMGFTIEYDRETLILTGIRSIGFSPARDGNGWTPNIEKLPEKAQINGETLTVRYDTNQIRISLF